jgi:hypothetical protein
MRKFRFKMLVLALISCFVFSSNVFAASTTTKSITTTQLIKSVSGTTIATHKAITTFSYSGGKLISPKSVTNTITYSGNNTASSTGFLVNGASFTQYNVPNPFWFCSNKGTSKSTVTFLIGSKSPWGPVGRMVTYEIIQNVYADGSCDGSTSSY